jgi:hypothetical protein
MVHCMTGPIWFEYFMAGASAVTLFVQLITGKLYLNRAPEAYRRATRATDPGRYWAFIIGVTIVTMALLAEALYRSFI